ncbi:MAG: MFS transporter [Phycisphaerae bacterium]
MGNRRRLFAASCAALVTNAMAFSICTDIMGDFGRAFELTKARAGAAVSWGAIGGTIVLFTGGALLDFVGAGTVLWLAFASHAAGLSTVIFAQGFWSLAIGWLFLALGSGLTHAAINPLAATLYPEKKTQIFSMLHAWWPGGIILGGLLAFGLGELFGLPGMPAFFAEHGWQVKMACAYVPTVLYAVLIFGQEFPKTERVQAGVSTGAMFREALRPMFLLLVLCMCLTASVELGPNRWVGVFIKDIVGFPGVLVLAYTSGLMFLLRIFAGPIAKRIPSMKMLIGSSVLAGLGLLWLSYADDKVTVFLAATVFAVGVCYFWPTMLGTTAERFPKGGAFLLAVIGAAGGLFLAYVTVPGMGWLHDRYTRASLPPQVAAKVIVDGRVSEETVKTLPKDEKDDVDEAKRTAASTTFRYVAVMAAVLVVLFGGILVHDRIAQRKKGVPESQPGPP